jgi:hypothetical protein
MYKGKVPCTLCKITPEGVKAFAQYVNALKSYMHFKDECIALYEKK